MRGAVDLGEVLAAGALRSVHGADLHLDDDDGTLRVDQVRIVGEPVACSNGVLVFINRVLAPGAAAVTQVQPSFAAARTAVHEAAAPRSTDLRDLARAALLRLSPLRPRPVGEVCEVLVGAPALRALRSG